MIDFDMSYEYMHWLINKNCNLNKKTFCLILKEKVSP